MERHEQIHKSRKEILFNNFLGGIAWALGATVGFTIVIAILGFIVKDINFIPFVGRFVSGVLTYVLNNNPRLLTK